jgi:hypothetical protein
VTQQNFNRDQFFESLNANIVDVKSENVSEADKEDLSKPQIEEDENLLDDSIR